MLAPLGGLGPPDSPGYAYLGFMTRNPAILAARQTLELAAGLEVELLARQDKVNSYHTDQ